MKVELNSDTVLFTVFKTELMLTNTDKFVWRIQSKKDGVFDYSGAAQTLAKDLGENLNEKRLPIKLNHNGDNAIISAEDGSYVQISDNGISFFNIKKEMKRSITSVKSNKDFTVITFSLFDDERIYGTGERFDFVNQRSKKLQMYAVDKWCRTHGNSYIPIPFIISSNKSAVFMNRYEHSVLDIGKTSKNKLIIKQKYAPADLYIFLDEKPDGILTAYSKITGFAPMPCDWSFGTIVCRYHPEFGTPEGIYAMSENMKKHDFPWDAVIVEGWWIYDKSRWSELKEVSENIHSQGKKLMVYQQCGRFPQNGEEEFGLTDDYAVHSDKGTLLRETRSMNFLDNFHHKKMRCVDLTNKKSVGKWKSLWDEILFGIGVDGAKIDFCEQFPDKPFIRFFDKRNPMASHHWFPTLYNTLSYRHYCTHPDGGITFSRGGGIGAQRFPFVWAGDQLREFFFLKVVLRAALSVGLSGVPFVSWDMGGYRPAWLPYDRKNEDKVFIRAVEFTAFSVNIQTHGNVKRPYDFDEHTQNIYRKYAYIHEALRPYIKEQAEISTKTGLPVLRHLYLYDQNDEKCFDIEDEYMLGGSLLVTPVLSKKCERDIYLPAGEWVNIFTDEVFKGNQTLKNYKVPLESIPVFKLKNTSSETIDGCIETIKTIY